MHNAAVEVIAVSKAFTQQSEMILSSGIEGTAWHAKMMQRMTTVSENIKKMKNGRENKTKSKSLHFWDGLSRWT